jgi:hypothetical protein
MIFFPDWISGRFRPSYTPSAFGGEGADRVLSEYVIVPERALVASPASLSDVGGARLSLAPAYRRGTRSSFVPRSSPTTGSSSRGQVASHCLHCNSHTPPAFAASSCHRPTTSSNALVSLARPTSSTIAIRRTGTWRSKKLPTEKARHTFWRVVLDSTSGALPLRVRGVRCHRKSMQDDLASLKSQ